MNREQRRKADILSEYFYLCVRINNKKSDVNEIRDCLENISPHITDMPRSSRNSPDSMGDLIGELIEKEKLYIKQYIKANNAKERLETAINDVKDIRYRTVLFGRYIERKKREQIAVDMNYYIRHIHRLQEEALTAINL